MQGSPQKNMIARRTLGTAQKCMADPGKGGGGKGFEMYK